jgi:fatty-acyl-CoA synthase
MNAPAPLQRARTLVERIVAATDRPGALTVLSAGGTERRAWGALHEDALALAGLLAARGAGPGERVALLGPTSLPMVTAIQATWLTGAACVVLPLPLRLGSLEAFVDQTRRRVGHARPVLLLVDPTFAPFLDGLSGAADAESHSGVVGAARALPRVDDLERLWREATTRTSRVSSSQGPGPGDPAILQYTSGSTSEPRGVVLSHGAVVANVEAITDRIAYDPGSEVTVSWLPLYHDMGLIGMLTVTMATGGELVLAPAQDFLQRPASWMEWMDAYGGTATAGPSFGFALATRALRASGGLDLSRWRVAINGAEPIDPAVVECFAEAAGRAGFAAGGAVCAFGMAEATLAVTMHAPGRGLLVDEVDRRALEEGFDALPARAGLPSRRLAKLGAPVGDLEVRILAPDGTAVSERRVGEIEIRGSSLLSGYFDDPSATADALREGWLRTGDLGYLVDSELVVCGRAKDVIVVGGRNVFPEDVEGAASAVAGVRAGNVVAFGIPGRAGRERVVVVAESRAEDLERLRGAVGDAVRAETGLSPADVVLLAPGTLPKTSSGKLQRSRTRQRYLDGELA